MAQKGPHGPISEIGAMEVLYQINPGCRIYLILVSVDPSGPARAPRVQAQAQSFGCRSGSGSGCETGAGSGYGSGIRNRTSLGGGAALAWRISLHGFSAPSLIAAQAARDHGQGPLIVTITGGHGELSWQSFTVDGRSATDEIRSTPITELASRIDAPVIYGTGAEALVTARGSGTAVTLYPDASAWPLIAALPGLPPSPIYGRGADAKTMAERGLP